tara:strand:+ start:230 stop:505 length:276 start_codon:yes stop_codon:yes gene_type:complete
MSNNKKFTTEEIDEIKDLRDKNNNLISEMGGLELEKLLLEKRLDSVHEAKEKLEKDFILLQETEKNLVEKLNEKYGAGTVDLRNGEFIPAN